VTGAADGYYRMKARRLRPLLHLGPGLANAWPPAQTSKKAFRHRHIVGQHAVYHIGLTPR